ncbi:HAD family hydrolase [Kitasatospora sp. NPDC059571]|uniref:HAD family hydrolase n=1 Tax=Kitasatospora sp. NPDC059571 TaxID=3346871 RepID=UPI0036816670
MLHPVPRLVATDLDGTLLRSDGTLSERTVRAVALAEAAGVRVVFVTGRPPRWMAAVSEHPAGHAIALCANGAAVYDLASRRLLSAELLGAGPALEIAERLRRQVPEVSFAVECARGFGHEPGYPAPSYGEDGGTRVAPLPELLGGAGDGGVLKLLAWLPGVPSQGLGARIQQLAGGRGEVTTSTSAPLAEISAPGVSKAGALARFAAGLGIARHEVAAFGDMPNDLPMLRWAGRSFAVANAHPAVLAAADETVAANDEDGVAQRLELFAAQAAGARPLPVRS